LDADLNPIDIINGIHYYININNENVVITGCVSGTTCSTIESDTTVLKQLYLKVNERFCLPAAGYKPRGQNS
jgi:hypothetical protein